MRVVISSLVKKKSKKKYKKNRITLTNVRTFTINTHRDALITLKQTMEKIRTSTTTTPTKSYESETLSSTRRKRPEGTGNIAIRVCPYDDRAKTVCVCVYVFGEKTRPWNCVLERARYLSLDHDDDDDDDDTSTVVPQILLLLRTAPSAVGARFFIIPSLGFFFSVPSNHK